MRSRGPRGIPAGGRRLPASAQQGSQAHPTSARLQNAVACRGLLTRFRRAGLVGWKAHLHLEPDLGRPCGPLGWGKAQRGGKFQNVIR